jgi:hypothetical protein
MVGYTILQTTGQQVSKESVMKAFDVVRRASARSTSIFRVDPTKLLASNGTSINGVFDDKIKVAQKDVAVSLFQKMHLYISMNFDDNRSLKGVPEVSLAFSSLFPFALQLEQAREPIANVSNGMVYIDVFFKSTLVLFTEGLDLHTEYYQMNFIFDPNTEILKTLSSQVTNAFGTWGGKH